MPFLRTVTVMAVFGSAAFCQVFTPPPVKSTDRLDGEHRASLDFGWGISNGAKSNVAIPGTTNIDYISFPSATLGYIYGLTRNFDVGAQINESRLNLTTDAAANTTLRIFDVVAGYRVPRKEAMGLEAFVGIGRGIQRGGVSRNATHYQIGALMDMEFYNNWVFAPYVKWSATKRGIDFKAFTVGVNFIVPAIYPSFSKNMNLTFGASLERADMDSTRDGLGLGITAGVEYAFK